LTNAGSSAAPAPTSKVIIQRPKSQIMSREFCLRAIVGTSEVNSGAGTPRPPALDFLTRGFSRPLAPATTNPTASSATSSPERCEFDHEQAHKPASLRRPKCQDKVSRCPNESWRAPRGRSGRVIFSLTGVFGSGFAIGNHTRTEHGPVRFTLKYISTRTLHLLHHCRALPAGPRSSTPARAHHAPTSTGAQITFAQPFEHRCQLPTAHNSEHPIPSSGFLTQANRQSGEMPVIACASMQACVNSRVCLATSPISFKLV
jgi:hypothetical protein